MQAACYKRFRFPKLCFLGYDAYKLQVNIHWDPSVVPCRTCRLRQIDINIRLKVFKLCCKKYVLVSYLGVSCLQAQVMKQKGYLYNKKSNISSPFQIFIVLYWPDIKHSNFKYFEVLGQVLNIQIIGSHNIFTFQKLLLEVSILILLFKNITQCPVDIYFV